MSSFRRPSRQISWWPSRYGPEDQAGALNEITPSAVVSAAGLVRSGRVYDLAHVLDAEVPAFPGRTFVQYLTTTSHYLNLREPNAGAAGLGRNNVNWITRGLCLDIAAVRGVPELDAGDVITPADAEAAADAAGLTVRPGDAVLFHTGWGRLWGVDNDRYAAGEPGPGMALADWLVTHRVALSGCDTWSYGPYPPEDSDAPFLVPQQLNTRHGLVIAENLRLAELADDRVSEFLLIISHAKLRGATGAWIAPLAIV